MTRPYARSGWALLLPLLVFIAVFFVAPIGAMLIKSVYDPEVARLLPATSRSLAHWQDETLLPSSPAFDALADDLRVLDGDDQVAQLGLRMNRLQPGLGDLLQRSALELHHDSTKLGDIDPQWSDPATWRTLKTATSVFTPRYLLNAVDLVLDKDDSVARQPEERRIYVRLFVRTITVAVIVTLFCIAVGYPSAYVLASARRGYRTLLLFVVLMPFWTSLLVRTTAWIVLLQRRGVINEVLVAAHVIADNERFALIYNFTGTIIVMVYVLLPFFVLPLQAVMRGIPPQYVRAAESLGGNPSRVFRRIYLPMTMPGVAAGASLVFILSLGYYVTPALVGGRTGQLVSNQIAYHIQTSLNWGMAAALGSILLLVVVVICFVLSRFARPGRMAS
jgi:putative spermidine/putrescine transport system permease protein